MTTFAGPLNVYDPATQAPDAVAPAGTIAGKFVGQLVRSRAAVVATGSTNADAAALSNGINTVTGGDATKGVKLPVGLVGQSITVKNNSAAVLKVYPPAGYAINALTVTTGALSMAANTIATYIYDTTAQIWSSPLLPS